MAERAFGAPCPGCTPAIITARMGRSAHAYPACRACLDDGAMAQDLKKQKIDRDREDEKDIARGQGREPDGKAYGQG